MVRLLLLRRASLKPSKANKPNRSSSNRANSKANSRASSQYELAFQCLVVVDVEEAEPMYLPVSAQPVALKRADKAMLVVEDEEDVVVPVVE
jgi:hypothetical protein